MVRRHAGTAFMGGAHVFPGGRVDPVDGVDADASWCDGLDTAAIAALSDQVAVAHRLAAIRELFEEAGVLLARDASGTIVSLADPAVHERFAQYRRDLHGGSLSLRALAEREGLRVALDALTPMARWVTPPVDVRQFDAWFFLARVPVGQTPVHDDTETTHGAWLRPPVALEAARQGTITLPPPTWTTLRELEAFASVDDARTWAASRRIEPREPFAAEDGDARLLLLPGDPLNPEPWHEPLPVETRFRLVDARWIAEAPPRG